MKEFPRLLLSSPAADAAPVSGRVADSGWLTFSSPPRIIAAHTLNETRDVITAAASAVRAGQYIAGFVAYEAAPVFDSAHVVVPPAGTANKMPLAWFAVYDSPPVAAVLPPAQTHFCGPWRASVSRSAYYAAVAEIRTRIAAGDVYQVNLTHALRARFAGCPQSLFAELAMRQPSPWRFFAETDEWAVCSASPECFFERRGGELISRPMKGTRRNEPGAAAQLVKSAKDRAENLMIVDMLRNDMSRLPDAQRVRAGRLLSVEEYPTVLQMISEVSCDSEADLDEIFTALFPCASVTGAPKIAAMKLIAGLERESRGVYCGACGWAGGGAMRFNVAIRTAVADKRSGEVRYGTGGGIVADSRALAEWRECQSKAAILQATDSPSLVETMLASSSGVELLAEHLSRLSSSARHFGLRFSRQAASSLVSGVCGELASPAVIRLTLGTGMRVECRELPSASKLVRACLYERAALSGNDLLRHKTTRRGFYDQAMAQARLRGFTDAVLQNERGELTETCIANIALRLSGELLTPAASCGLLPGVLRARMLKSGELKEGVLRVEDLRAADKVWRLNAVRGMEEMAVAGAG